ncbi:MAG: DUF6261 family protein [Chitinophagaceae bacterium]
MKKQILTIHLVNLRNNDYAQFLNDTCGILARFEPAALLVLDEYDALRGASGRLQVLLNNSRSHPLTASLKQLDARRNELLRGMQSLMTGYSRGKDLERKSMAGLLLARFAAFGKPIARQTYQNKTNKIKNIVDDWTTDSNLAAAITSLDLDGWKTDLETFNTRFNEVYINRSIDEGTANPDRAKPIRKETDKLYTELRNTLEAAYRVHKRTKPEPFLSAILALNGLIGGYKEMMERRTWRRAGGAGAEGEERTALPPTGY